MASQTEPENKGPGVFRTFFGPTQRGHSPWEQQEDLCKLLVRITAYKMLRQVAFHKRGKRDVGVEAGQGDEDKDPLMAFLASEPTPEATTAFLDHMEHFLAALRPEDRRILELCMEGWNNVDIAKILGITDRKIRRLKDRIRAMAEHGRLAPLE
jgi:DNA-directed RNA polymerase specialized sigma24 family protein